VPTLGCWCSRCHGRRWWREHQNARVGAARLAVRLCFPPRSWPRYEREP
jgi:hypothetical protein